MNKTFVLFSFLFLSLNAWSAKLNFIELYLLRSEHEHFTSENGASELLINSSERFYSLYNNLQNDKLEKINNEIEQAYSAPYMTRLSLKQYIKINNYLFRFSMHESLSLRVNNPVFPELELFNVRTDSLSIQKTYHFTDKIESKFILSFINRWYIDQTYSLEEVVTDDLEIDLKDNETISTLYLDLFLLSKQKNINHSLEIIGLDLLNKDLYDYHQIKYKLLIENSIIDYGFSMTPLYNGEYNFEDTLAIDLRKIISKPLSTSASFSELYKNVGIECMYEHFSLRLLYEQVKEFSASSTETRNYSLNIQLKY